LGRGIRGFRSSSYIPIRGGKTVDAERNIGYRKGVVITLRGKGNETSARIKRGG